MRHGHLAEFLLSACLALWLRFEKVGLRDFKIEFSVVSMQNCDKYCLTKHFQNGGQPHLITLPNKPPNSFNFLAVIEIRDSTLSLKCSANIFVVTVLLWLTLKHLCFGLEVLIWKTSS